MANSSADPKSVLSPNDSPPEIKHVDDMEWEVTRFGTNSKFLFHPTEERPTEPCAGVLRYDAGASFRLHRHDFAQVWYVIEGELQYGDQTMRAGNIIYHPDSHYEHPMHTENGCSILFVQYQGHTTGAAPIYDGRMNLTKAQADAEQDLKR
jgi:mannose-6-phosphate isomerase-like protein (cupin superfamily)